MPNFGTGQLHILRRLIPETTRRQRPHTVPCRQCGKPIEANDAIMGLDKRILCRECYNTLHAIKDKAKE